MQRGTQDLFGIIRL